MTLAAFIERLTSEKVRGQLRHLLTAFGPLLASHGITTDAYWQIIVGILMAVLAMADSWRRK